MPPTGKSQDLTPDAKYPTSVSEVRPFDRFVTQLGFEAEIDSNSEEASSGTTAATVERILSAETEEEIWNAGDLVNVGGRDLADVEITINSFTVRWSQGNTTPSGEEIQSKFVDPNTGRGMYFLIAATRMETGEDVIFNTSAPDIVPKLIRFRDMGKLPLDCVIRARELGGGRKYLLLKPVPKRAVKG